jgi:SAM-dependent methyltransferase
MRMPARAPKRRKPAPLTARTADRHALYQLAVQAPEGDTAFFARYFQKYTGRRLRVFREDFCGTALISCHWVRRRRDHVAVGVDLCGETLAWGKKHNVAQLLDQDQQRRLHLIQDDVRAVHRPAADFIAALNFSYSVFQTRGDLADYLANSYRSLRPGGLMCLDAWGGPLVQQEHTDRHRNHGFDYLWEQRSFDPIKNRIVCSIHFEFRDGTRLRHAFHYDWRLWSLPELIELFTEAGFQDVHVLWEGTDHRTNRGNGVFLRKQVGEADDTWIAYVVGQRPLAGTRRR